MFSFIKNIQNIFTHFTAKFGKLFLKKEIDAGALKELGALLLGADVGVPTTRAIIDAVQKQYAAGKIASGTDLKEALKVQLLSILNNAGPYAVSDTDVFLLVGINGSGKTSFAGKLAHSISGTFLPVPSTDAELLPTCPYLDIRAPDCPDSSANSLVSLVPNRCVPVLSASAGLHPVFHVHGAPKTGCRILSAAHPDNPACGRCFLPLDTVALHPQAARLPSK